jgi:murein DD-endopeptidase MepM/ murein hydrolase activator NlpD
VRYRSDWFLREARAALDAADWIGAHAYECYNTTDRNAGGAWRNERDAAPGKPLAITEFSSPLQSPGTQARQYRAYYETMRNERDVFAAFCFCVYGDHFQHESWRTHDGRLLPHAAEVAQRKYGPAPVVPKEPPGIVWLPEPHALVYVDDKYGGAIIRDYAGREYKHVAPGTELARRSQPATIAGWTRRVVVNRELGLHVLADRIHEKPAEQPQPQAVFAWPTEHRVVTQAWAARPAYYAQWGLAGHEGIDLRAPLGSRVFAAEAGRVTQVSSGGNYGNQVRIEHVIDGRKVVTVYAHLQKALVAQGETVARGQVIGLADSTGNADGSHLHFGVRPAEGGTPGFAGYVDPRPWLGL